MDTKHFDIIKDFNVETSDNRVLFDSILEFNVETIFGGLVKKDPFFNHYQLRVEIIEDDENIIYDSAEDIVLLRLKRYSRQNRRIGENVEGKIIENFTINNYSFPYSVVLNHKAFKDYTNIYKDRFSLKLKIISESKQGGNIREKHEIQINYQLHKFNPKPEANFVLNQEFINGFEHRKDDKVLLGYLEVNNNSEFIYAHDLAFTVKVLDKDKIENEIYFFGDVDEYEQTNPKYDMGGGLRRAEEQVRPMLSAYLNNNSELQVEKHNAQNTLKVPVYVNMGKLPNPVNESFHTVSFSFTYTVNNNVNYHSFDTSFQLLKDTRTTALMTFLNLSGKNYVLNSNNFDTQKKYQWIPQHDGWLRCFRIRIGNFAENNNGIQGAVRVKNLTIDFNKDSSSPSEISLKNGGVLGSLFEIINYNSREYIFPDEQNSFIDFDIRFCQSLIQDIPQDRLFVNCRVSFDYQIVENYFNEQETSTLPNESEIQHFETKVFFEIEKYPGPYWLAVDFGTSAIVTAGSGGDGQDVVIDLQNSLYNNLKNRNLEANYEENNVEEYNSTFLSSTLMFNDNGRLIANKIDEEIVALSPLVRETNDDRRLPYIKSLIGTETIPNFKNRYTGFKYFNENREKKDYGTTPIATKKILHRVYDILFKYYINPEIINKGKLNELNKLVLSIPNSFTPRHLSDIKSIIHTNYPNFKQQYLTFITESDAVASFYLKKWYELNEDRPEELKNNLASSDEYVLIYDMGAGTLDLTYFHIKTDANNDKKVNIIGRLGSTIAGNYLDFVIAQWIYNKYAHRIIGNMIVPEDMVTYSNALKFKQIIQQVIKPQLNRSTSFVIDEGMIQDYEDETGPLNIDMSDFFGSNEFKEYIDKNSYVILENLFSSACPQEFLQKNVKVDTIVFSGRGVQVANLKDRVKDSINNLTTNDDIHHIELPNKDLKSAVVEGALQYALLYKQSGSRVSFTANNLQAKYGVLYRNPSNNKWGFREMLNPTTKPVSDNPIFVDGNMIYEYDTDIHCADDSDGYRVPRPLTIDFSATATGFVIQTYALDPAKDANAGNFEFISKMMSISRNLFSPDIVRAVSFRIVITKTNTMKIYFGDYENNDKDPLAVDPENDKTFIRSMWPLIVE